MIKILKWGALVGTDIFQSTQHSLPCTQANVNHIPFTQDYTPVSQDKPILRILVDSHE